MYIMQGLPGSGKSTKAKEIVERTGNTVRINKDLLRKMLHFDKFTGRNEEMTRAAARIIARSFLTETLCNVIIDDTNLNPGTLQSWKDLAKEIGVKSEVVKMETSFADCLKQNVMRPEFVPMQVIIEMAMQYGLYPKPSKGIVICDIDGTLADCEHRQHWVRDGKKDWKSFFAEMDKDTPRTEIVDMVMEYEGTGCQIMLVSGRPDTHREVTEAWLEKVFKGYSPYRGLFMRRGNDSRPDDIVKQEIYDKFFKDKYPVDLVIDDRPSVIRMWKANGLNVQDVGDGKEF